MNEPATKTQEEIISLNNVRLSFPALFTAKSVGDGDPKFGANFILDRKIHATLIAKLEKAIERTALDKFKKKVNLSPRNKCLHDGNEDSVAEKDGYGDDVMYIRASTDRRPAVVDRDLTPLAEQDSKPYAGCYVNATIRLYAWEHKTGGRGVSAGLRAVQFVKDGEAFGAGPINPEDEFKPITEDDDAFN